MKESQAGKEEIVPLTPEQVSRLVEAARGDHLKGDTVDALLKGRLEDVRATLEQVLEQVGVDEGESRVAIGEGPTDDTGEPTQEEEEEEER